MPILFVAPSEGRGRGVYTSEPVPQGTTIEISPVIVMDKRERALLDQTTLHDYIFEWGTDQLYCCMALGYVPVYNHSYTSNCEYEMDFENDTIHIKTVRPVEEGEELTINYNGDWNDPKKLWFEAT